MELKDSGDRREFDSGAVRDIAEGKGRCDLLPLEVVAMYFSTEIGVNNVLLGVHNYIYSGDIGDLFNAIRAFKSEHWSDSSTMFLEVAKHYEDGAKKYSERNWEKGLPVHCYIDSGVRHYLKFLRGDDDEPHDRAFVWNMLCAIRTHMCNPDCIDLPFNSKGFKKVVKDLSNMKVGEKKNED